MKVDYVVGYSFGEYSVFVVGGFLEVSDVIYFVCKCGELMEVVVLNGVGVMVVVFGVDWEILKIIIEEVIKEGDVV